MGAVVVNKLPLFGISVRLVMNDAVREAARDTLIAAKTKAPHLKGGLRSDTSVKRVGSIVYRVSFFKEYARYQEFGGDANRTVRNYSTPGTGKHYLKNAGDEQVARLQMIFKKHGARARA